MGAGSRDEEGGRRARLGGIAPSGRPGPEAQVPDRQHWSKQPSNVYSVRAADLDDAAKGDLYTRFLQGVVMGLEFTKANPRAAAQITYNPLPDLQKSLKPQAALDSMLELAHAYGTSNRKGKGWGYHPARLGELPQDRPRPRPDEEAPRGGRRLHEQAPAAANKKADVAKASKDAKAYKLNSAFARRRSVRLHDVVDRCGASRDRGRPPPRDGG